MAQSKQRLICIVGPTASGKSACAVDLAKKFGGEIISADSRQVYRGLDTGTGKITKREMNGVPHHLLDVASPKKQFTAHDFAVQAQAACSSILQNNKIPIICGGTGFYIDALVGRIQLADVPRNEHLRTKLNQRSAAELFAKLKQLSAQRAATIDRHNKVRLIRAIEVAASPTPSSRSHAKEYDVLWIGLSPQKDQLRQRINKRLEERLRKGMIAEARRLHAGGLSYKRMHDLGLEYRSLARFLQKKISRAQLEAELQVAIWRYAKRQMTYWRRNEEIEWFAPNQTRNIEAAVKNWLH